MNFDMEKFPDWITRKFVEWQASQGKRKTIEEFAAYLGTSRPIVNMWMNGNKKPGAENIKLLAQIFDYEIYDVLEKERPDPDLTYLQAHWLNLPPKIKKALREEVEKYITKKE